MWYSENDFRIFAMMSKYSLSPWYLNLSGWEHWMKELLACNWSIIDSHVQLVPADTVRHYESMHYSLVIDSHYGHCTLLLTLYSHTQTAEARVGGQTTKTNWWPLIIGLYISDVITMRCPRLRKYISATLQRPFWGHLAEMRRFIRAFPPNCVSFREALFSN